MSQKHSAAPIKSIAKPSSSANQRFSDSDVNANDDLVKVGELKKPYGIKGWLWVYSQTQNKSDIFAMQPFWIRTATGWRKLTVKNWRKQGRGLVAQFNEISDRTLAETMLGTPIWVEKDQLPKPDKDEYYWADLLNLTVYNLQDENLGQIKEMLATGAHDVMRLSATADSIDDQQRLIPWHEQTVKTVDLPNQTVIVDWEKDY